jgi:hypothetical protein
MMLGLVLLLTSILASVVHYNNQTYNVFKINQCASFYSKYIHQILGQYRNPIIKCENKLIFGDTSTNAIFYELNIHQIDLVELQPLSLKLYPITPCLKLNNQQSSGLIEINYENSWDISHHFNPSYNIPSSILNATFAIALKLLHNQDFATTLNFKGIYTCFTNGTDLQLFVEPVVYRGNVTIVQTRFMKNQWIKENWYNDSNIYYISNENQPIIHCVTRDKHQLQC